MNDGMIKVLNSISSENIENNIKFNIINTWLNLTIHIIA